MLILRRQLIEIGDLDRNLFINLHLDTAKTGYLSDWDRLFQGEFTISKPWTGDVKTNEKQFKITRTRTTILIVGQEVNDGIKRQLKLTYKFSWLAMFSIVIFALILFTVGTLFQYDIWFWLICLSVWTIQILLTILDLNKTEERFNKYLDSLRSNAPQSSRRPHRQ